MEDIEVEIQLSTIEKLEDEIYFRHGNLNYSRPNGVHSYCRLHIHIVQPLVVAQLLEWKADPNLRDIEGGYTPLMSAVYNHGPNALVSGELLLKHGADYDIRNDLGLRAMDLALGIQESHGQHTIALLMKYGDTIKKPGKWWHEHNRDYGYLIQTLLLFTRPLVIKRLQRGSVLPIELIHKLKEFLFVFVR